jgi:hypothetical protein
MMLMCKRGKNSHMLMSLHKNAGKIHDLRIDNKSFGNVSHFKHSERKVTARTVSK